MKRLIPKKGDYRMRAHMNPFNKTTYPFPPNHTYVDWSKHFPKRFGLSEQENIQLYCNTDQHPLTYDRQRTYSLQGKHVDIIDIGCGYGGLLFGLAHLFPNNLIMGLEIRHKIVNFVAKKIVGYRIKYPTQYDNIGVVRTNTMRHLCQYFPKQSLQKIFVCFPDPNFKEKAHKRRIINTGFLSQYAYLLKPKGRLYCVTDVLQLHEWHVQHLRNHQMFAQLLDRNDPCIDLILNKTEESKKVERKKGEKYYALFEKREILQKD